MTFLVWAAAAASIAYWALKLGTAGAGAPVTPVATRAPAPADPAVIARLMGQTAAPASTTAAQPSAGSRVQLVGVVADRSQHGVALLAVDGRPAKPYRVGSPVDENLVLQSVQARKAVLAASANGPAVLTLELPPPPR